MKTLFLPSGQLDAPDPLLDTHWAAVMVMPYTNQAMAEQAAGLMAKRAGVENALLVAVEDVDRAGFIAIANEVFDRTQCDFFGYTAQDAFPGRQWLARALHALLTRNKHFLGFNDGKWMGALASFGLARRNWALANYGGALFYPGYQSHYADVELTVLALNEDVYCYDANSVLVEVDWTKDDAKVAQNDRDCYRRRVQQGFEKRVTNSKILQMFF